MNVKTGRALVLFSGGQDSSTALAWALEEYSRVETIGFDYGQRHRVELDCRTRVASALRALKPHFDKRLGEDHLVDLSGLGALWDTAMTRAVDIKQGPDGPPNTFVPGRNLLFLQIAASLAYGRGLHHLVGGMSEAESSGYPDCRQDVLKATVSAINAGMGATFELRTPLMKKRKADVWTLAKDIGGEQMVNLVVEETHTCYVGCRDERYEWGYGCRTCPACELRAAGYARFRGE